MSDVSDISGPRSLLQVGSVLNGTYEIDAAIAIGGMGEIYKGHEIQTGDPVAIKVIRADMADDPLVLALFRKEASALNRIHHEAIVRYFVFSLDPILRRHYLAMEFVEGESLSNILKRGPLDVVQVHALQMRLASGLQAAHDRHIIHRDVSPDNVIVSGEDVAHARIIDFGIARSNRVGDLTVLEGGFAGKYGYVSPEQLGMFDGNVTGKSDIYSLGLVLAYGLLGEPIDMGRSQLAVVEKRKCVPDLCKIDPRMRPLLERMLRPDPADRPASMAEVASWPLASLADERTIVTRRAVPLRPAERVSDDLYPARVSTSAHRSKTAPRTDSGVLKKQGSSRWKSIAIASVAASCVAGVLVWTQFNANKKSTISTPADSGDMHALPVDVPRPELKPAPSDEIDRFVYQFNGGECFLAVPSNVSAQAAEIDGYGLGPKPFEALDEAFKKANGFEAKIEVREVTPAQCPALVFVKQFLSTVDGPLKLEVGKIDLRSGDKLQATLDTTAANIFLLIVDDEGLVYDVTNQLRSGPSGREFAMLLQGVPARRPQPWLLLAIASAQPIGGLGSAEPFAGKEFFPSLGAEVRQLTPKPAMAVRYLNIN
ncbi:MAG TPA: serine/threonine-protein kinase [Chthoniobacterales bacterium]|nr:serine/threonine-protein kinase [Chthoniobacterales bacterium]